ncbi:tolloid-like protein 2, partial [Saccoglossus kowalevskii]|uniref:Bone morphogenetic protein 1-like n=1 Tax=Saccoglossus kowalevskii TaxID=10224 RepID=A0ABM0MP50_SACKO
CSDNIVESKQYISSPNYPEAYNNKDQCIINIVNPDQDACVRLIFLAFDVQDGSTFGVCDRDSLMIEDSGNSALSSEFCGNRLPPPWVSSTANVVVTFSTDPEVTRTGYEIYVRFEDCPQFIWQSSEWSDVAVTGNPALTRRYCGDGFLPPTLISTGPTITLRFHSDEDSVHKGFSIYELFVQCPLYAYFATDWNECSVSCGDGERNRIVTCHRLSDSQVVNDLFCAGTKPSQLETCTRPSCLGCDSSVTSPYQSIGISNYDNNQDCEITITNVDGCIALIFLSMSIEAGTPNVCENDYLEIDDLGATLPPRKFCGNELPHEWFSVSGNVVLRFHSNDAITDEGFSVFVQFVDCPTYVWDVADWSACDADCGGGTRSRTVTCQNSQTQYNVSDTECPLPKPSELEECNTDPCP